ncbi:MAG: hypothetical protein ACYDBQ_11005 [Thermoplasmatota archaeon]
MSDDNRISVRMEPQLTPVRLEDKMDLNAEIKVAVDSHLTGLGMAGLIGIFAGILALVAGLLTFILSYPERWYAVIGTADYDTSRNLIKTVVGLTGAGVVLLFVGTSMFFYGRTVLGSGHLDRFTMEEPLTNAEAP